MLFPLIQIKTIYYLMTVCNIFYLSLLVMVYYFIFHLIKQAIYSKIILLEVKYLNSQTINSL